MFSKLTRCLLVPALSFSCIVSSGFAVFVFNEELAADAPLEASILLESDVQYGMVGFLAASYSDHQDYRIVFEQGGAEYIHDEEVGVSFVPSLRFIFFDYKPDDSFTDSSILGDYAFFYYFSFANDGAIFGDDGYAMFREDIDGQSPDRKIELVVDYSQSSTEVSFSPQFRYRPGRKPTTSAAYQQMMSDIHNDEGSSTLSLHIVLERKNP